MGIVWWNGFEFGRKGGKDCALLRNGKFGETFNGNVEQDFVVKSKGNLDARIHVQYPQTLVVRGSRTCTSVTVASFHDWIVVIVAVAAAAGKATNIRVVVIHCRLAGELLSPPIRQPVAVKELPVHTGLSARSFISEQAQSLQKCVGLVGSYSSAAIRPTQEICFEMSAITIEFLYRPILPYVQLNGQFVSK
jgi:hypothetical protein